MEPVHFTVEKQPVTNLTMLPGPGLIIAAPPTTSTASKTGDQVHQTWSANEVYIPRNQESY